MSRALGWKGTVGVVVSLMLLGVCSGEDVTLNEIQVLHAHNSFHLAPDDSISNLFDSQLIQALVGESSDVDLQRFAEGSRYSYPSVFDLLDVYGVRSLEFDCFYDPEGGHYSHPAGRKLAGSQTPFPTDDLDRPGWKVLHIPDIDFNTTCQTLVTCLDLVRLWSVLHTNHVPIFISIEPARYDPERVLGEDLVNVLNNLLEQREGEPRALTTPVPVNRAAIRDLLDEIQRVFDPSQIITPSEIKGNASSLREAIARDGWPLLSSLRGRVLFIMSPVYTDELMALYPGLVDSPIFPSAYGDNIDNEDALFVVVHATDPSLPSNRSEWKPAVRRLGRDVRSFVDDGYMVRAFADSATQEARELYFTRRDRVIKAGAHLVATDYPGGLQSSTFNSSYTVELAGGNISVCNPRSARASCQSIRTISSRSTPPSSPSPAVEPEFDETEYIEEDRAFHVNVISVVLICCVAVNIISLL